jgi:16S rRNA G966 N2-methylase RsmD/DNA-directed RNA polymerase subunit RPC12/RpoP
MANHSNNAKPEQSVMELPSTATSSGPVEYLGMTFPSDTERRKYFLEKLAEKLKDPEFRKIEGFPIGADEDILALSDPPYYTACPNPWLADFVRYYGRPFNPRDRYHREPFAADVSEGKNHPIYNAHSYHTKVPHRAIMRYILHYTEPGDLVFDGFAGTGMTGVAAQLCGDRDEVHALGYRIQEDGAILDERGHRFSKLGTRRAILNDLSPSATFIAYNQNFPVDTTAMTSAGSILLHESKEKVGSLYSLGPREESGDVINNVVWSEVLICANCSKEFDFWTGGVDKKTNSVKNTVTCPHCGSEQMKRELDRAQEKLFDPNRNIVIQVAKYIPVAVEMLSTRLERELRPDEAIIFHALEEMRISSWFPTTSIDRDIDLWYERDYRTLGLLSVDRFYTRRNLAVLADLWQRVSKIPDRRTRNAIRFAMSAMLVNLSRMNRWRPGVSFPYNPLSGTLYIPSLSVESNAFVGLENKIKRLAKIWRTVRLKGEQSITTQSTTNLSHLPSDSLDYVFIDPPFGSNIIYSDLSILHEAWLRLETNTKEEAVVHRRKKQDNKTLEGYRELILACLREAFRCLKPGRWITIEFSNTRATIWNAIQTTLQEAGFVVANVAALDKQMGSFKAVTTPTAVKQDLVISAYKPNGGLEARFTKKAETEDGVWDFIRTHLANLPVVKPRGGQLEPIVERDPRILFDRTVAFYVRHGIPVPISSPEFQAGLAEKFPERDGMYFLPNQAIEYDKARMKMEGVGQLTLFVEDERSAVAWLHNYLKNKPCKYQDIQPEFFEQLNLGWKKWETRPELRALLDQYFLCYTGEGDVPPQIHSYLSTNFKELRNLPADHAVLRAKARDRWYVPDPRKNADVEQLREKRLLEEFWAYMPPGYEPPARRKRTQAGTQLVMEQMAPKIVKGKRIAIVRTEAVRVGFNFCFSQNDYQTIIAVARHIPEAVIQNDEQLQMIYDSAVTRTGGGIE